MQPISFFNTLSAQNCIDFEAIINQVEAIEDVCNCEQYLELGEVGQTKYISDYQLASVTIENECIKIYGKLIIDERKNFVNCDFIMDAESEIVLDNPFITFESSTFQACGSIFWKGISIGDNGGFLTFRNNIIKHAWRGISSFSNSSQGRWSWMHVHNNTFINNVVSISIGWLNPMYRSRLFLTGNTFYTNPPLKNHWIETTIVNDLVTTGVIAVNTILDADASNNACQERNVFIQLLDGFVLSNSESSIHSNFFYNFNNTTSYPGTGIRATKSRGSRSTLVVDGGYDYWSQTGDGVNFKDVASPIRSFNTETTILSNKIEGANRAIEVFRPVVHNKIELNDIQVSEVGIEITDNMAPEMRIQYNSIEVNSDIVGYSRGIEVSGTGISANNGRISCNLIDLNPGRIGILANHVNRKELISNIIHIYGEPSGNLSGIEIRGGEHHWVGHNEIAGSPDPESSIDEANGLKVASSFAPLIEVNETYDMEYGFHFSGSCFFTQQIQNIFYDHRIGYFLDESAIIGQQVHNRNRWEGTYGDYGALLEEPTNNIGNSHLIHENYENTTYDPGSINPDPGWFYFSGEGSYDPLTIKHCITQIPKPEERLDNVDSLIARYMLSPNHFTERRKWEANRYLYKKIMNSDSLDGSSYPFNDFMDSMGTTEIHDYYKINMMLDSLTDFPSSILEDIMDQDSLYLLVKVDSDYWLNQWENNQDSLHYLDSMSYYNEKMDSIRNETDTLYDNWEVSIENGISSLNSLHSALASPNIYASNEKFVLEAIILSLQHPDSIPLSMLDDLKILAENCALEHGTSVYRAGALLNYFSENRITESVFCEDNSQNRIIRREIEENKDWLIHPNPTTGMITVDLLSDQILNGTISVINMEGKVIMRSEVMNHQGPFTLDLQTQPSGIYILRWVDEEGIRTDKLKINR